MTGWVVKIGGSLCSSDTGLQRAVAWLQRHSGPPLLVVTGGGTLADRVRELDQRIGLSAEVAHRMALRTMRVNLQLLHARLGRGTIVSTIHHPIPAADPLQLLDVEAWLEAHPRTETSWRFTSDSIAALAALESSARRLVLLKSCAIPAGEDWTGLARLGIVDSCFPELARELSRDAQVEVRQCSD